MTSQQLADRLAEIAGWRLEDIDIRDYTTSPAVMRKIKGWRCGDRVQYDHPFPLGSLDALERWRGENLPGWEFWAIYGPIPESSEWSVTIGSDPSKSGIVVGGPTEWDARAAALVAAKEQSK